jgi:hypothetical protein
MHPLFIPPEGGKTHVFKCNSDKCNGFFSPLGEKPRSGRGVFFTKQNPLGGRSREAAEGFSSRNKIPLGEMSSASWRTTEGLYPGVYTIILYIPAYSPTPEFAYFMMK